MGLPVDIERQLRNREAGRVRLLICDGECQEATFDQVASAAGLHPLGERWCVIDAEKAVRVVASVLHRDLAYGAELLPLSQALRLAEELVSYCGGNAARFATNTQGEPDAGFWSGWNPATEATLDGGILVLGRLARAVYWVEDED